MCISKVEFRLIRVAYSTNLLCLGQEALPLVDVRNSS